VNWLNKIARKIGVTVLGVVLLIAGAIMLVLPGPGILVIIIGLVVLSWEYEWAEHHLHRARKVHKRALTKIKRSKNT
jgi:uncharacterized protein (TIGR02611 family)